MINEWDMKELKGLLDNRLACLGVWWPGPWPSTETGMAACLADPDVADWLITRSMATPYLHLPMYMDRYWLFNPYLTHDEKEAIKAVGGEVPLVIGPSGRIHHILREDHDRVLHDHPWPARTFILRGWYIEERLMPDGSLQTFRREAGDTATLAFGEYHRIIEVSPGGVWTLFVTWDYQGVWGFLVDGVKVPYKVYLGME